MDNEEDIYIIPHNYTDNGKILGIIEKESIYLAIAAFVILSFVIFKLLPLSLDTKISCFIIGELPIVGFCLIGLGGETLIDFARYVYHYRQSARVYEYEK